MKVTAAPTAPITMDNARDAEGNYLVTSQGTKGALVGPNNQTYIGSDETLRANCQLAHSTSMEAMDIYRGLGAAVNSSMSIDQQLAAAGLDFELEDSDIRYGKRYQYRSTEKRALYRKSDGALIDIVSANWAEKLLHLHEVAEVFNDFCSQAGVEIESMGAIKKVTRKETATGIETGMELKMFMVTSVEGGNFELSGHDAVTGKLMLTAPYKFGSGYDASLVVVRKVCNNGQHLPVRVGGKILAHTAAFPKAKITEVLQGSQNLWASYEQEADLMSQVCMSSTEAALALVAQFSKDKAGNGAFAAGLLQQLKAGVISEATANTLLWDKVVLENESKLVQGCYQMFQQSSFIGGDKLAAHKTAWGLVNCVTEWYNHHAVSKDANVQADSLWHGAKQSATQSFLASISSLARAKAPALGVNVPQTVAAW